MGLGFRAKVLGFGFFVFAQVLQVFSLVMSCLYFRVSVYLLCFCFPSFWGFLVLSFISDFVLPTRLR